ncbi:unnamed protein product [marine sediment metagenome]|uniref:Uncharacterized protein n=1 Tax=marine sediment metagenome TaxID=412755 RepID=X1QC75_9ZZZZ
MKQEELLKQVYDYFDNIKKPFDQRGKITTLRCALQMIEDGLSWKDIKDQLGKYF